MTVEQASAEGEIDREEIEEQNLREAIKVLVDISHGDRFVGDVEDIVANVIATVPSPTDQLAALQKSMTSYFDDFDLAARSFLVLCAFPREEALEAVPVYDVAAEEQSAPLLETARRVAGLHGGELAKAFAASEFDPDNWSNLEIRYSYMPANDLWRVELEIIKFNEQRAVIDGPAISFLRLINYVLTELTSMPADVSAFGEELNLFQELAEAFLGQYQSEDEAQPS